MLYFLVHVTYYIFCSLCMTVMSWDEINPLSPKNNVAENCILSENVKKANCYVFIKPKICGHLLHQIIVFHIFLLPFSCICSCLKRIIIFSTNAFCSHYYWFLRLLLVSKFKNVGFYQFEA